MVMFMVQNAMPFWLIFESRTDNVPNRKPEGFVLQPGTNACLCNRPPSKLAKGKVHQIPSSASVSGNGSNMGVSETDPTARPALR